MGAIAERVAEGAALLDEHVPGWDQRINLDVFKLESTCNCVLGQLFAEIAGEPGAYITGLTELGINDPDYILAYEHGFDAYTDRDMVALERQWLHVIRERRTASLTPPVAEMAGAR